MKKNKVAVTVATSIMLLSSGCFALANPTKVNADTPQASFDISKYGAKANDPSFDNAPIINKLIDQLPKTGGVIEIPAGTYYLKTPINVDKSFVTIQGVNNGWRSGVDPANSNGVESGGSHLELVNKNTDAIDVKSADSHRLSGDEFKDINIEGQSSTGTGINVQSDNDHIVIDGTSMKNLGTDIVNKGADCTRITNNQLAESRNNIDLTGASQQAEIEHNQLGAQPGGISVQLENPSNYAINSNLIYPDGSSDITLYNPSHGTVWGNTLSSYTTGLINVLPNSQGAKGNANVIASNQLTINQFNKNGYATNTLHNDLGWGAIHDENYRDLINHNNLELNAPKGTAGIVMNSSLGSRAQDNIVTVNNLAAVDNKVPQPAAPTVDASGSSNSSSNSPSTTGATSTTNSGNKSTVNSKPTDSTNNNAGNTIPTNIPASGSASTGATSTVNNTSHSTGNGTTPNSNGSTLSHVATNNNSSSTNSSDTHPTNSSNASGNVIPDNSSNTTPNNVGSVSDNGSSNTAANDNGGNGSPLMGTTATTGSIEPSVTDATNNNSSNTASSNIDSTSDTGASNGVTTNNETNDSPIMGTTATTGSIEPSVTGATNDNVSSNETSHDNSTNNNATGNVIPDNSLGNQINKHVTGTTATTASIAANTGVVDMGSSSSTSQKTTSHKTIASTSSKAVKSNSLTPAEKDRSKLMSQVIAGNLHKDDNAEASASSHSSMSSTSSRRHHAQASSMSSTQASSMELKPATNNAAQGNQGTNQGATFAQTGGTTKISHNWLYNLIYKIFK